MDSSCPPFFKRHSDELKETSDTENLANGIDVSPANFVKEGWHESRQVGQAVWLQRLKFLLGNLYVLPLFVRQLSRVFAPADCSYVFSENVHVLLSLRFEHPVSP